MLTGFKDFLLRGNIVDLAVAVVIGTAFTALVTSFSDSFITPLLTAIGGADAAGFGPELRPGNPKTLLDFGAFISAIITFVITAAVVYFFVVVPMKKVQDRLNRGKTDDEEVAEDIALLRQIRDSLQARNV